MLDARRGQVIRGAGAHHATADDDDVGRRAHAASTAARATIRSSNANPTDLKTRDVRRCGSHAGTAHDLGEVGDHVFRAERALADRDRQLSGFGERRFPRLDDDPCAQHRGGVQLPRRGPIAADGVHVRPGGEPIAFEERLVAGRARADHVGVRHIVDVADVRADAPVTGLVDERPRSLEGPRDDGDVPDGANRKHRLEMRARLHAGAEDHESLGVGVGQVARRQAGHRCGAERGERGAVEDRFRASASWRRTTRRRHR